MQSQDKGSIASGPDNTKMTQQMQNKLDKKLHQPQRHKQSLKIVTLNINRRGNRSQDKWGSIHNIMKKRKIAVLAL